MSVAETTVTMTAVILLIFLLFKLFGKRIKAKSRYIILCIVLLRLAIPIGIPSVPSLLEVELLATPSEEAKMPINEVSYNNSFNDSSLEIENENHIPLKPLPQNPVTVPSAPATEEPISTSDKVTFYKRMSGEDWFNLFSKVYFIGAGIFLFFSLLTHSLFIFRIKKGRTLGEEHVYSIYADVCRQNGISDPPLIWESTATDSPMIIGLLIPRVVLPSGLDENALAGMLAHELKHFTRRDLWVKFACLVAKSLHWFNPLVHFVCARCVQEMELSCDAEVLENCDIEERREYGTAMLNVIRNCRRQGAALTTHFSPNKKSVKARFIGIMDTEKKKRGIGIILFSVILCLISGVLISCSITIKVNDFSKVEETTTAETTAATTAEIVTTTETHAVDTAEITEEVVTSALETMAETEIPVITSAPTTTKAPYVKPVPTTPSIVDTFDSGMFKVTEYRTADNSLIYWDIKMYNGQTITYVLDDDVSYCPSAEEIVTLEDVNFDGHSDVLICKGGYGVQGAVSYHCYLYTEKGYELCPSFSSIPNPVVDNDSHLIKGTYRESASKSVTEYYTFSNGTFIFKDRGEDDNGLFFFTDFSSESVLDDFKVFRGAWAVRDGRLWLDAVEANDYSLEESCGFLLYKGNGWESLTDYQVDVDVYDIYTQTGILSRCDLNKASPASSNAFYGYFSFVSKTGRRGAHGYANPYGNWGSNLIVSNNYFTLGADLHLTLTVIGNELRCVYSDLESGEVILDLSCSGGSCWSHGTFGLRMLNQYQQGPTSLGVTSFDNLRVTKLS